MNKIISMRTNYNTAMVCMSDASSITNRKGYCMKLTVSKDMMYKEPSPFCNGMYCCENKTHNSKNPMCKECDKDYEDAMEQVRKPTPQMVEEMEWFYASIMGEYNVCGV